jgi:hypothetical protein
MADVGLRISRAPIAEMSLIAQFPATYILP